MTIKRMTVAVLLTAAATGAGVVTAVPASAGGVGDFLSPAFGTDCANLNTGAQAAGHTIRGSGAAGGNLLGLPIGSPLNQCGGADMVGDQPLLENADPTTQVPVGVMGGAIAAKLS
ncbi:chaplin family protein [Streptomyces microflavus]|uniref:chaplin family protein n=1 Tax=Streptomyces microflavus TaxID=1919 RepID=UPI0033068172